MTLPDVIEGMRIRKHSNNCFSLPRKPSDKALLALDMQFARLKELTWGFAESTMKSYTELRGFFEDQECYIVGKGPSLDHITEWHFPNPTAPIIAINQAIHKIETLNLPNPIFCMQQDLALGNSCQPKYGAMLVSTQAMIAYKDFERRYIFAPLQLKANTHTITAVCAITMARELGCDSFILCCFDACITKETTYAECVGRPDTGDGRRFLGYCQRIKHSLGQALVEWCVPGVLERTGSPFSGNDDTQRLLQLNHEEHHDDAHYHDQQDDLAIEDLPSNEEPSQQPSPLDH